MAKKQFKAESKRLLDLMINSIYTHKEIFLREIISNASDAIDKLTYKALSEGGTALDRSALQITLIPDEAARTLTVRDNGVGMTKEELEQNLGTIAKSGSLQFKKDMAQAEGIPESDEEKAEIEKKSQENKDVLDFVKQTLGDRIKEARVSKLLKSGAVCMTADGPITLEMEKYFQKVDPENARNMKAQRVLELNPDSGAFAALRDAVETDPDKAKQYAELLYHQALLIAGLPLEDPAGYTELVCALMK